MMDLEYFLENYSMTGFSPYIVVSDNQPVPVEVNEDDYEIWDIKSKKAQEYVKKFKVQKNTFKEYTGYVIVVKKGAKVPIQTCFLTSQKGVVQNVQNIIILEENSEAEIFTGCLSNAHVNDNEHNALTDIFVGKNSKLTFNMVHSWGKTSTVKPKTKVYVEENGVYLSNYVVWDMVRSLSMNPKVELKKNAKAVSRALVYSHKDSELSIGGSMDLIGEDSGGEMVSSVVSDGGVFKNYGEIVGNGDSSRGHIECDAILLSDGLVEAVPTLKAFNSSASLSHEASVGKISKDEIEYLQTKGLDIKSATELIVKGFVNSSISTMPLEVQKKMKDIVDGSSKGF